MNRRIALFLPLIIFIVVSFFLFRGLYLDPNSMPSALLDKPMPQFSLPSLEQPDKMVTRADILGRVTLVNVWATWCPSCVVEHPFLVTLAEREQIPIVGVDYKDESKAALKWLDKLGNPYVVNIVDEEGKLGIDLGVYGAPETYLLDRNGVIRYKHVGVVNERVWAEDLKPIIEHLQSLEDKT